MNKKIKHENLLRPNPGQNKSGYSYFEFICRAGNVRRNVWNSFISSQINKNTDNSYLMLVEEPSNKCDPNAVMILCRGAFWGNVGYVGREYTVKVKEILKDCFDYRVDVIDESKLEESEVPLLLTWETIEQHEANQKCKELMADIINYRREGRTFVPDLLTEEPVSYGKYGYIRLDFLKKHRQDKYTYYLMKGRLGQHLVEVDVKAKEMVEDQVKKLLKTYPAPDRADTLAWTGHMNSLKQMAEEVVLVDYIYK